MADFKYKLKNGILTILECDKNLFFEDVFCASELGYIEEVIIPEGVEELYAKFYLSFKDVKKIHLPNSLKRLGSQCFACYQALEKITIPEGVEVIPKECFISCYELKTVSLPKSIKIIKKGAFDDCYSLQKVEMGDMVEKIEADAFNNCYYLKEINLPKNLKKIESRAFYNNNSLEKIEIPKSVETIEDSAFNRCRNLKEVTFEEGIKNIGDYCFAGCVSLEQVNIPNSVEKIMPCAFVDCEELKEVTLPKNLQYLGERAFESCKSLTSIELPDNIKIINEATFQACNKLESVKMPSNLTTISERAFMETGIKKLEIPEGVIEIQQNAFARNHKLEEVILPFALQRMSRAVFGECVSLKKVIIPHKITKLEPYLFAQCLNLKEVELTDNIIEIGEAVFNGCQSLKRIDLPNGVERIDDGAFCYCTSLKNFEMPNSVNYLGDKVFDNCQSLEKLTLSSSIEILPKEIFSGLNKLKVVKLPENLKELSEEILMKSKIEEIVIPSSVTKIGKKAFYRSNINKITLSQNIKEIDINTFSSCSKLEEITIPEGVEEIKDNAFFGCRSLKKVILPSTLKKIGKKAFEGCQLLESIEIPQEVTELPVGCFTGCSNLKDIKLPNKLKKISFSFGGCFELKEIEFPASLEKIEVFDLNNFEKIIIKDKEQEKTIDMSKKRFLHNHLGCLFYQCLDTKQYFFYYKGSLCDFFEEDLLKKVKDKIKEKYYPNIYVWKSKKKFLPQHIVIENMPVDDIDLFYKNNNYKQWAEIFKLANIKTEENKTTLFKLCYVLGVFQESGSKRDNAVDYIKEHIVGKMNEDEIHARFDGLDINNGFDEMYADFFMKYYKENPYFMNDEKGKDYIVSSYNNFKTVKKIYQNKSVNTNREADILLPVHVLHFLKSKKYEYVDSDNQELAVLVGYYGYTQYQFDELQSFFNEGKNIKINELEIFISDDVYKENSEEISYELLSKDNPLGAVLGNITNCCQVVGGAGESCVEYGMTMPNSKFMTFNLNKQIIGQSWVWYDEYTKVVCLDNIEVPSKYIDQIRRDTKLQESFVKCLKRVGENFIEEMKRKNLKVNKVTIGKGFNDIVELLNKSFEIDEDSKQLTNYDEYSDARTQYIVKKG